MTYPANPSAKHGISLGARELMLEELAYAASPSDACTYAPDWAPSACIEHDYHYAFGRTLGGQPITRAEADRLFRLRVSLEHTPLWARLAYRGVRLLGWVRWGGPRNVGPSGPR